MSNRPATSFLARLLLTCNARAQRAVKRGDAAALEEALRDGAEVEYIPNLSNAGSRGDSAVHIAVRKSDPACLAVLIAHNANLNSVNNARNTPLRAWFEYQKGNLSFYKTPDNLPADCLEVGYLLVEHGAQLGRSGRHHVLAGTTPRTMIDRDPLLQQLEAKLQVEVAARALARATALTPHTRRPGPRL